ncbi:MAG: hypothetical protein KGL74_04995, partial [Elusimicrobia bacterium]|nr:hypothetical protein [Elusimicrobiota bacterium]
GIAFFLVLTLLSAAARAGPDSAPPGPEPENAGSEGSCSVRAMEAGVRVPVSAPALAHVPDNMNQAAKDSVRAARRSISSARRGLDRMEIAMDRVISATNECGGGLEDSFAALRSTAEAAVYQESGADVERYARWGWKIAWETAPTSEVAAEASGAEAPRGRYAAACRAPAIDVELFAPVSTDLPPAARGKLAAIAASARIVGAALSEQKRAFDELLPLAGGRDCRALLSGFDRLVAEERAAYFAYRRKAVAAAVWEGLTWTKISPPGE